MKVLQFTTWYSPRAGGVETHVKRLSEELRRLRWEVEIFTLTDTREPYTRSFPSFQIPGIPYGFDPPVPGPRPLDEPYILCVGRVEFRHKGQDLLLDAFQKSRVPHALVYLGDGPDLDRLRARSRGLSKVRLLGHVDEVAKGAWMSNADLVVVPSRTEPFGIVALEAGCLGRRLVATRVGGLQHIAGPFATMTNPDPTDIAKSMLLALSKDPPGITRDLAQDYSWERMAIRVLDVYQELTVHS